jgi:dTMP kinase
MKKRKAFYVIVEGIDGSGKSTLCKNLEQFLTKVGHDVVQTKEPTDRKWGAEIRHRATTPGESMTLEEEIDLFVKDRRDHMDNLIKPSLEKKCIILQDRSFISVGYQSSHKDSTRTTKELLELNSFAEKPDLVILLDISVDKAMERITSERATDDFENKDRLTKVREAYLETAEYLKPQFPIVTINGDMQELTLKNMVANLICNHIS